MEVGSCEGDISQGGGLKLAEIALVFGVGGKSCIVYFTDIAAVVKVVSRQSHIFKRLPSKVLSGMAKRAIVLFEQLVSSYLLFCYGVFVAF